MPARRVLDELTERLAQLLPEGTRELEDDVRRNLRATLEAVLARMDLVGREEFDAQAAVLARCRARLDALERQVAALEEPDAGRPSTDQPPAGVDGPG